MLMLCFIPWVFALPTPALRIMSILSANGDGCPAKRSVWFNSSAFNTTSNTSTSAFLFNDMTPQAVLAQGAVASRWCEIELELEVSSSGNESFVADLDTLVYSGRGFAVQTGYHTVEVSTSISWSWNKSIKPSESPSSTYLGPDPGSGSRSGEPVKFQVYPPVNSKSVCSNPVGTSNVKPTLTIWQRYAVVLGNPGLQGGPSPEQYRAGVMAGRLDLTISEGRCS